MCGAGIHFDPNRPIREKNSNPFYYKSLLSEQCWQSKPGDPYMVICANCGRNWIEHKGGEDRYGNGLVPYPGIGEFKTLDIENIWLEATTAQRDAMIEMVLAWLEGFLADYDVTPLFIHDLRAMQNR